MPNVGAQKGVQKGDIPGNQLLLLHRDENTSQNSLSMTPPKKSSNDHGSRTTFYEVELLIEPKNLEKDNYFRLNFCINSYLATILEDTIKSLRIIEELNSSLRIIKVLDDMPTLSKYKYGIQQETNMSWLDRVDPKRLTCLEYKLRKLSRDRSEVHDVLLATYVNMVMTRSYRTLWEWMKAANNREEYKKYLINEEAKNKIMAKDLRRQLRQQRNHQKSEVYAVDRIVDELVRRIEDSELTAKIKGRYIGHWQIARHEQQEETIRLNELTRTDNIDFNKMRYEQETRIHQEIELIIAIAIQEALQEIEAWMSKYEKDMERMDLRITIMKNDFLKACDRREALEKKFKKHADEMEAWNKFTEDRRNAKLYAENMKHSAIVVQAWWRGLLVRLQLGPYRPKKRKGGAKPKELKNA